MYSSKLGYFNGITLASMVHYVMANLQAKHEASLVASSGTSSAAADRPLYMPPTVPVAPSGTSVAPAAWGQPHLPFQPQFPFTIGSTEVATTSSAVSSVADTRVHAGPLFPEVATPQPVTHGPGHSMPVMVMVPGMAQPFMLVPIGMASYPPQALPSTMSTVPSGAPAPVSVAPSAGVCVALVNWFFKLKLFHPN